LNVRGGSCRPHRMQFAMSYTKVSAVEWVVGLTEHDRGVDEWSERERFTGAKARTECASDAALKGRSFTVRDRVGSAMRDARLDASAGRLMLSHASLRSAGRTRRPPLHKHGGRMRPPLHKAVSGLSLFCATYNPSADTGLACRVW
jgi:hypothetical protein